MPEIQQICALIGPGLEAFSQNLHRTPYQQQVAPSTGDLGVTAIATPNYLYADKQYAAVFSARVSDVVPVRRVGITAPIFVFGTNQYSNDEKTRFGFVTLGEVPSPQGLCQLIDTANTQQAHAKNAVQICELTIGGRTIIINNDSGLVHGPENGRAVLTKKENQLLGLLILAEGRRVSRKNLLNEVWGYDTDKINTHTLETHIYRARQKIGGLLRTTDTDDFIKLEQGHYSINLTEEGSSMHSHLAVPKRLWNGAAGEVARNVPSSGGTLGAPGTSHRSAAVFAPAL